MDHTEALELIELAAAEPGGLERLMAGDTPEGGAVAGHLAGCPPCVAELTRVRRTAAVLLAVCSILSYLQAERWHDSVTLFRHALEVTENNSLAHKNLGAALAGQGKLAEALRHVTESLRIQPEPKEYVSQAWLYLQLGEHGKALQACRNSIAMSPADEKAHFLAGVSQVRLGDPRSAVREYQILRGLGSLYADRLLEVLKNSGVAVPLS